MGRCGLKQLIESYRALPVETGQRELAKMEKKIWDRIPDGEKIASGGTKNMGATLARLLGGHTKDYRDRYTVLRLQKAAGPLWKRLDSGSVTLGEVRIMLPRIRSLSATMMTIVAIRVVLKEYDDLPTVKRGRKTIKQWDERYECKKTYGGRAFWPKARSRIRAEVMKYFRPQMAGLTEHELQKVEDDLDLDIKALTYLWARRLTQLGHNGDKRLQSQAISRHGVVRACSILEVGTPPFNLPIDLVVIRKQYHSMARRYHPDAGGTQEEFEKVVSAFDTLTKYNEQLSRRAQ